MCISSKEGEKNLDQNSIRRKKDQKKEPERSAREKAHPVWVKYVAGTLFEFQRKFRGVRASFADANNADVCLLLHSTIPLGGAVSSSAALEV